LRTCTAFAKKLEAERPGIGVTRAEAVQVLLIEALMRTKREK
jgi:hypothetical protein